MATPEKDNVTEIDLFSALGLGGSGSAASSRPSDDGLDDGLSDLFGSKRSSSSAKGNSLDDEVLLDIFTTGGPASQRSSKGGRRTDAKVAQEREAQLKEKAIRSRQWKEELERKKREQIRAEEAARREAEEAAAESESPASKSPEPSATSASAAKKAASTPAAKEPEPARSKESKEIITVKANPVILENKSAAESRDSWEGRDGVSFSGRYGREVGVSGAGPAAGAREPRDVAEGRQPRRDHPVRDGRATQPLPTKPSDMQGAFTQPLPQQQPRNAAVQGRPAPSAQPYGAPGAGPQPGARGGVHPQEAWPPRAEQRPYQQQPQPRPSQPPQGFSQDPAGRPRMAAYDGRNPSQDLRQSAPVQPEEPSMPAPRGKGRAKDDPLGIVLIVLAVLCVLVAASLLTGLWDISNL